MMSAMAARDLRGAADMGQQDHVVPRGERGGHMRLLLEHIEPGPAEASGLQGRDQRGLVDHLAAGDIDDHAARTDRLQHLGPDQARRSWRRLGWR